MTFRLGLTGSIGMGKSTTAQMFADAGIPVWDADATVHHLYAAGGLAARTLAETLPEAMTDDAVDRRKLKQMIAQDGSVLTTLERVVHPLVSQSRADFAKASRSDITLFDIPLLYETEAEVELDAVAVVSTDPVIQRARVLARDGMTDAHFQMILARQMPDVEKRARATYVICTDTMDAAQADVQNTLQDIRTGLTHA